MSTGEGGEEHKVSFGESLFPDPDAPSRLVLPSELDIMPQLFHPVPELQRATCLFLSTVYRAGLKIHKELPSARFETALKAFYNFLMPDAPAERRFSVSYFDVKPEKLTLTLNPAKDNKLQKSKHPKTVEIIVTLPRGTEPEYTQCLCKDPAKIYETLEERRKAKGDFGFEVDFCFSGFADGKQGILLRAKSGNVSVSGYDFAGGEKQESKPHSLDNYINIQPQNSLFGDEPSDDEDGPVVFTNTEQWVIYSLRDLFKKGKKLVPEESAPRRN